MWINIWSLLENSACLTISKIWLSIKAKVYKAKIKNISVWRVKGEGDEIGVMKCINFIHGYDKLF